MSDADNSSFWSRLIHGIVLSWKHFPPIRLLDSTPISSVLSVYCTHTVGWPVTVLLACTIHTLKRKDGSDKIRLGSLPLFWCLFIKLSPVLVFLRADALCVPGFWVVPQTWSFHSKMLVKNSGLYPGGSVVRNPPAKAGDTDSIPSLGRSPGEGNDDPFQYFLLESLMDRGPWWATVL